MNRISFGALWLLGIVLAACGWLTAAACGLGQIGLFVYYIFKWTGPFVGIFLLFLGVPLAAAFPFLYWIVEKEFPWTYFWVWISFFPGVIVGALGQLLAAISWSVLQDPDDPRR